MKSKTWCVRLLSGKVKWTWCRFSCTKGLKTTEYLEKKNLSSRGFGFVTKPTVSEIDYVLTDGFSDEKVPANYLLEFSLDSLDDDQETELKLAQLEKEIELQTAKNEALSLNPAAKVEDKQFETNIENMIKSIKTLSLPVPTRSENFNLFFQSLERAFLTKKINDEYKSEILINLLGERAHNVLLYIKEEELNDYEKLKSIVLREF
ncbi:uncharacterized protein TNCV_4460641 [Trichonephila clavipes]|nr:uncharacterized protein TNCV_4460641 [Trichonephila clavipes]